MNRVIIILCFVFSLSSFFSQNTVSQPLDPTKKVVIESIFINNDKQPDNQNKFLISETDSITINFKLHADGNSEKSPFLFRTVFKNGLDSSVKTLGVTSAIFKNLKNDNYFLSISAFDLQRKWSAESVDLEIEVDNEKYNLKKKNDSLEARLNSLSDLIKATPVNDSLSTSSNSGMSQYFNYILIFFVVALIAALIIVIQKKPKVIEGKTSISKPQAQDYSFMKNVVSIEDYEKLQLENSRLKAEIASLRGQIEAMSLRGNQLTTQNKELQNSITKLSKHKLELEELQKQKDDLFAVIIHDIKNPASLIKSLVELLTSYDLSASEQQEIISDIANTTIKIVALSQEVSRILSLETNKMNLNFEPCDINHVVKDVFHRNHIAAKNKSINLFSELEEGLPNTEIDPQRIDEVLDNLISNSIKFTQNGGTVRIKTYKDSSGVVVEVNDNGLGLTEEDLKHAFQRGARLSAKPTQGESSTGLGLWIVKKLIDAHHGKVWVKSTVGKGSTFSFSVPLKQEINTEN
ncbi:MAG: HAMP domain-containing histidine kinase [Candidatus Kapabacteria bacterium]|nr:HAMP domain-containing histidine kinase [Ignavibacteriota bacterium]MCW5886129.1 HAMP domain-containing histidine kinase [Candidatus Kapabacteria bacterium]